MIEAFFVLAGYVIYEFTPRQWRMKINWWFWTFAVLSAIAFSAMSLLTEGAFLEPAG